MKKENQKVRSEVRYLIQSTMFKKNPITQQQVINETGLLQYQVNNWLHGKSDLNSRNLQKVKLFLERYESIDIA